MPIEKILALQRVPPGPMRPFETVDPSDLAEVYRLNTAAPAWLMGSVLRQAVDAAIWIVNVSSGAAQRGSDVVTALHNVSTARERSRCIGAESREPVPDVVGPSQA